MFILKIMLVNIYYMFLFKCDYFADKFKLKKWKRVLINEKSLRRGEHKK